MVKHLLLFVAFLAACPAEGQFLPHRRQAVRSPNPGGGGGGSEATPPLDQVAGARSAYDVTRRLSTSYSGSLIRVRRVSDNVEADIGYTATGELDQSAIATHCGAANGMVVTFYDHANSWNITISTASKQPKIYDGGTGLVLLGSNGKPCALFDGSDDFGKTAQDTSLVQPNTIFFVGEQNTWVATSGLVDGFGHISMLIWQNNTADKISLYAGATQVGPDFGQDVDFLISVVWNGTSSTIRKNNESEATVSPGTSGGQGISIGGRGGDSQYAGMRFQSLISYIGAVSSGNQGTIRTNYTTFFGGW